tara:strand:- start:437 stop:2962 length:2526 start_codon:yes stop_codon:yes gene_type:complete
MYSCSTEKNAFLNRSYHYVTVKYNGYFNGNESFKLAEKNIKESDKDDFDDFLDVFQYGNPTINKNEYSNLDRAITKGAKMIDRHSMKFKVASEDVEYNKMIDDCYLLIGKARFLKFDLEEAKETFLFIKNTFKKGEERHKARLWLVMTYIYQENFVDAETTIKAIEEDKEFPQKLNKELSLIHAISLKRSGQIEKAIPVFEKVISLVKKKKLKRRLQYILAQLYQNQNDSKKASDLYKIIAKKATNYDLQFNAKINLARTYDGSGNDVINILKKMLKDAKNIEYQDQIYFALAQVYEKQEKQSFAIENYKLSAKKSVNNLKQKGKSFLALGDYYFKEPDYLKASNYYDSSLIALPNDFPKYEDINAKKESLKDLVQNLKIVQEQDSLLKIAKMTDKELAEYIENKISQAKQMEEEKKAIEEAKREKALANASIQTSNGSSWIFDNPKLLASGLAEFKGFWGGRPLEDNWRRVDKSSVNIFINDEENEDNEGLSDNLPEDQTDEFYLKNVPFRIDQQEIAHQKIINSYYQLGIIYRDNFNDIKTSTFYFNSLNTRYPKNSKEAVTWYQLYRNYDKSGNILKKEELKNKVINNYPNSEYSQLLLNPDMLAQQEQKTVYDDRVYEEIFYVFKKEQYEKVISDVNEYRDKVKRSELKAKFDLIHAFAKGNLFGKDTLEFYLRKMRKENSGTEAADDVIVILERFENERKKMAQAKKDSLKKEKVFVVSENEPHYFVMIYSNEQNASTELLNKISDFNDEFYSTKNLKSKSIAWSDKEDVIVVNTFRTNSESGHYYGTFKQKFLIQNEGVGDLNFMISKTNYSKLFKYKEVIQYIDFYKKNYSSRQ